MPCYQGCGCSALFKASTVDGENIDSLLDMLRDSIRQVSMEAELNYMVLIFLLPFDEIMNVSNCMSKLYTPD